MNLERWRLFVPIMLGGLGFVFVSDWIARGCGAALILLALGLLWYWSANPVLPDLVFTGAAKVLDDLPAFETFSVANNRGSAIYDVSIQPFEISGHTAAAKWKTVVNNFVARGQRETYTHDKSGSGF